MGDHSRRGALTISYVSHTLAAQSDPDSNTGRTAQESSQQLRYSSWRLTLCPNDSYLALIDVLCYIREVVLYNSFSSVVAHCRTVHLRASVAPEVTTRVHDCSRCHIDQTNANIPYNWLLRTGVTFGM